MPKAPRKMTPGLKWLWALGLIFFWLTSALVSCSYGHEWYPAECCHDTDCKPVPLKDLVPIGKGCWEYLPRHLKFCGKRVRASPDGGMHVCIWGESPMCAFVPPGA